jgi:hypothetical protein
MNFIWFGDIHGPIPCKFIGSGAMGVTKLYKFTRFGDSYGPKPYKFIGFGDSYCPKPYKFTGFGDSYGPKPYKFIGFGDSYGTKLILLPGKNRNRPSGRPKAGWRADVGVFPVAVRPKSGPGGRFWGLEALLRNIILLV